MAKRLAVVAVLLPVGLLAIYLGGIYFTAMVVVLIGIAAWEYARLFEAGGLQPCGPLMVAAAVALVLARYLDGFRSSSWLLALGIMASMTFHLFAFERGRDEAGTDFAITLSGILYLGWLGAYLVSLRELPSGMAWVLVALPVVWLADTGAYLVGRRWGRRKMAPRLSPKKSWEGYWGGVAWGTLSGVIIALLLQFFLREEAAAVTPLRAGLVGLVLSLLTPLGDLGESMIKRQVGVKDSSNLLPGHGGAFDRIDSWLWAGVIGYYLITWLF